jgi:hypothetical protein
MTCFTETQSGGNGHDLERCPRQKLRHPVGRPCGKVVNRPRRDVSANEIVTKWSGTGDASTKLTLAHPSLRAILSCWATSSIGHFWGEPCITEES